MTALPEPKSHKDLKTYFFDFQRLKQGAELFSSFCCLSIFCLFLYHIWTIRGTSTNENLRVVQDFTNFYNFRRPYLQIRQDGSPKRATAQNIGGKCKNRWRSKRERASSVGRASSPTPPAKSTAPQHAVHLEGTALSERTAGTRQLSQRQLEPAPNSKTSSRSPSLMRPAC